MCKGKVSESPERCIHPLEPLSKEEIGKAAKIVKEKEQVAVRFEMVELKEPSKDFVRTFQVGDDIPRFATVSVYKLKQIGVSVYTIDLGKDTVVEVKHHADACPMIQLEEFDEIEEICKNDPEFVTACKRRGIENVDLVCVDPWSAGVCQPGEEGKHVCHAFCWVKTSANDNLYAHPIEGLHPVVDIKNQCLIRVDDNGDVPIPKEDCNYEAQFLKDFRSDLKPIDVIQSEGVSFSITGKSISWYDWNIVMGFNAREGLTLHDISYDDRPVLYRASIAEMVVPYGSPKGSHYRKNVFDIGKVKVQSINFLSLILNPYSRCVYHRHQIR